MRDQVLAQLERLAESIFSDMFGRGHHEMGTVGDVSVVQGGLQVTAARKSLPMEFDYLRVANVFRNRLDLSEVKTLRVTEKEFERTHLIPGDVLVVEGHGNRSEVGRAAIWNDGTRACVHQNHLIRVRFDDSVILPEFGVAWLNSSAGRQYLLRAAKTTSGLNTISTSDVKAVSIPLVPLSDQWRFVHRAEEVSRLAYKAQSDAEQTNALFASLQARAFAGLL